jgi:hypothetical protein
MRNPFQYLRDFFRKPAMIGTPPSRRPLWHDPAAHARDFAERYAELLEYVVVQRMTELQIPADRIGYADPDLGGRWRVFNPHQGKAGEVMGDGIGIDSGVLNPELLKGEYTRATARLFERSRLRDRLDAIIAHEYEEYRNGFDHREALKAAPRTDLPISDRAREILRAMEKGWKGKQAMNQS